MVLILIPDYVRPPGAREMTPEINVRDFFVLQRRIWSKTPRLDEPQPLEHPVKTVIVSWTEQPECVDESECVNSMWELQEKYRALGQEIPYNFVVGGDATVYECRGWFTRPAPCERHPDLVGTSIEIAHVGTKHADGRKPIPGMLKAVVDLVEFGIKKGYVVKELDYFPDYDLWWGTSITEQEKNDLIEREIEEELNRPDITSSDIPDAFGL